MLLYTHIRIYQ